MSLPRQNVRPDMIKIAPKLVKLMREFSGPIAETGLSSVIVELIKVRASQINQCAFCLEMHINEALALGVSDYKLHMAAAWREASCFTPEERAALELCEAVTLISNGGVDDDLYERVSAHFSGEQYVALLAAINTINSWNRFMIATGRHASKTE